MEAGRLPREVFLVLAAVGWADGVLDRNEADAIARAAVDEGLDLGEIQAIEQASATRVELADIDVRGLSSTDRLYVYAMASWIAAIGGAVTERERAMLDVLGYTLRLTPHGRSAMDSAVKDLLARPEADRPSRFDLGALKRAIAARVEAHTAEKSA